MTPAEKKLVRYLLTWTSIAFCEAGDNDLDLIDDVGLTPEEALEVKTSLDKWLEVESPTDIAHIIVQDWQAMGYAASRLEETNE